MMTIRLVLTSSLSLLLAISVRSQEVAFKDLLHPSTVDAVSAETGANTETPKGCEKVSGGFVDGVTLSEGPREIKVGLASLSDAMLIIGNEVSATVKLQNAGGNSITIPWSTDYRTTQNGQDPANRTWEFGQFQMTLRKGKNQYTDLINTSQPLYGSKFLPGSTLTIKPGEWITARIGFRVAEEHPKYERIEEGPADLAVEWFQTVRTHVFKGCVVYHGFFPYDGFHEHKSRVTVQRVEVERPEKAQKSSQ